MKAVLLVLLAGAAIAGIAAITASPPRASANPPITPGAK